MNEAQELIIVNAIEGIGIDIRRLADALAPTKEPLASSPKNHYNIRNIGVPGKFYCCCTHDEFRHTLTGFECHRCLKFYPLEEFELNVQV